MTTALLNTCCLLPNLRGEDKKGPEAIKESCRTRCSLARG